MFQTLTLVVTVVYFGFATSINEYYGLGTHNYKKECIGGSDINTFIYRLPSPELERNRTCLTKCTYDKEGRLDPDGNLVISKFPKDQQEAVEKCWKLIQIEDLCKKVNKIEDCVIKQTDKNWRIYDVCEEFYFYTEDTISNCFWRCRFIVDGTLLKDGSVNMSQLTSYGKNKTFTDEEALEICADVVPNINKCDWDVNMYYCFKYVISHNSKQELKNKMHCSKKTNTYPFYGYYSKKGRSVCYEVCLLEISGEWNSENPIESKAFKNVGMTQAEIETAFGNCKMTLPETDRCSRNMYLYDCIKLHNLYEEKDTRNSIDCALETNSTIIPLRMQLDENYCKTRCLMIKRGELDKDGNVKRSDLEKFTIDSTLVDQALEYCDAFKREKSCFNDLHFYYCTTSKLEHSVYKLCGDISDLYNDDCALRCIMIHSKSLHPNGTVAIDPIMSRSKQSATEIKRVVAKCEKKYQNMNYCARDLKTNECANSEIRKLEGHDDIWF